MKNGFTMSEVLITLGIIGVVMAMTMPTLIRTYRKNLIETELQKSVSILEQAIRRSEIDNESAIYWEWTSVNGRDETIKFFDRYFRPYLSITQTRKGYVPVYKPYSFAGENLNWWYNNNSLVDWINLSDGSVVRLSTSDGRGGKLASWHVILPHSGRNSRIVLGRDAFVLAINLSDNRRGVSVYPNSYLGWTCKSVDKNRNTFIKNCKELGSNKSGNYPDSYCTMLIYCNNWTIPDDYPLLN